MMCRILRLQRCDEETHPPIGLTFSLTTVALTNSIHTLSVHPSSTCSYQGNRWSIMHNQWGPHQTECWTSLKSITQVIRTFWPVVTNAAIVKSLEAVFFKWGDFLSGEIADYRLAIQLMWSWQDSGTSVRHFPREMREWYGDNYFLQSSGLPPALVLCVPSVTDLHQSPLCACVCSCVCTLYLCVRGHI